MRKKAQCIKWFISTKAVYRSTTGTGTIKGSGQLLHFFGKLVSRDRHVKGNYTTQTTQLSCSKLKL